MVIKPIPGAPLQQFGNCFFEHCSKTTVGIISKDKVQIEEFKFKNNEAFSNLLKLKESAIFIKLDGRNNKTMGIWECQRS